MTSRDLDRVGSRIREERDHPSRFPARFILVSGADAWAALIPFLKAELPVFERLSARCSAPDVWPQLYDEDLRTLVSQHRGQQCWIAPLGEILRFFPHRADIIGALAELECNDTTRLFIPLLEVDHIFESAINKLN
ncbi:MAG: hypothetical protein ACP5LD_15150, partial [Desulfomonilaceae bacterium]